jgi:hypothetical protein
MKHTHTRKDGPNLPAEMRALADRHPRAEASRDLRLHAALFEVTARDYQAGSVTAPAFVAIHREARRVFMAFAPPQPSGKTNPDWPQLFVG